MPGVARVDHRTKCVSMVAISLSQNFETRNCWAGLKFHPPLIHAPTALPPVLIGYTLGTDPKENTTSERTPKKMPPRNGPQRKYHPIVVVTNKQTDLELTKKKTPPLPSPSNTHTKVQRKVESQPASQPVSLLYI
jgi:hypothetical protein